MPSFSKRSKEKLATCHKDLQVIFNEIIKYWDCSILVGERTEEDQNAAFRDGLSQLKYPASRHNNSPSMAVDVSPYPIDWKELYRFYWFAGIVDAISEKLFEECKITHHVRWGGDWDNDKEFKDNNFNDLVHFELIV